MAAIRYLRGHVGTAPTESQAFIGRQVGYREANLVGRSAGSVHAEVKLAELLSGGHVDHHAHSGEEAFYVLDGAPRLISPDSTVNMSAGGFGWVDAGCMHAWRNDGAVPARWLAINAPLPLPADPTFATTSEHRTDGRTTDGLHAQAAHTPRFESTRTVPVRGFRPEDMDGVEIDWLVDDRFGASLLKLFLVCFRPGGVLGRHDHPFEESYLILEGEIRTTADELDAVMGPGDFLWTGVGCMHSFENTTDADVIFLETQAPQPPRRHPARFMEGSKS